MVECGYKYKFFGDDAVIASNVLHIFAHMDKNFNLWSGNLRGWIQWRKLVPGENVEG